MRPILSVVSLDKECYYWSIEVEGLEKARNSWKLDKLQKITHLYVSLQSVYWEADLIVEKGIADKAGILADGDVVWGQ